MPSRHHRGDHTVATTFHSSTWPAVNLLQAASSPDATARLKRPRPTPRSVVTSG